MYRQPVFPRRGRPRSAPPPKRSTPKRRRHDAKPRARVTVLVVEDDPASAKLLGVVLESEGYAVEVAASAEQALERLRTVHPDVILLDLILPLMSGLLLADRLKASPTTADIPLVAVTAFNGHRTERIAAEAGFVAYVHKPIDPTTLAGLVAAIVEEAR